MALPAWPSTLPQLRGRRDAAGTDALYAPPRKTTFDDGPARFRRQSLTVTTPLKISLDLTFVTFPVFLAFVRDDLNAGTRRFTAPVVQPSGSIRAGTVCRINEGGASLSFPAGTLPRVAFTLLVYDWGVS